MVIDGFVEEDVLNQKYADGDISAVDYVKHHSQEMLNDYNRFLENNDLQDNEESADAFLSGEWGADDAELTDSDGIEEYGSGEEKPTPVDVFNEWTRNNLKLEMLLGCDDAAKVTLWRYGNPNSNDERLCAEQCGVDDGEVHEWWDTIDFIVGSLGGCYFTMANPTIANMKSVIQDAVAQAFFQE